MSTPKPKKEFSRRKFIVRSTVGVGVAIGATYLTRPLWRRSIAGFVNSAELPYNGNTDEPRLWFEVTADNEVILNSPKVEMGQGTFTGLAQNAADELEVDIQQIKVIHAPTASGNIDGTSTGGSTSISSLWQPLRELAATMREMLKIEAAKQLGTDAAALTVKDGVVSHNGRALTYGEIVKNVTEWEIPETPPLKDVSTYKFVGKPVPRVDLKDKVIGAHAQMEPNGAVAHVEGDKATIIMSTQVVNLTRQEVADRLGLAPEDVNIIPTYLGGGFGRRLHTPNAVQAAVLSKTAGKPVKCFFNRREEFQNDTFRPPTHHVLRGVLDKQGKIKAIEHNLSSGDVMFGSPMFPGIAEPVLGADAGAWRGGMIQYEAIPNFRTVSWRVKLPFATSWWRSLGLLANTFAIESFMDELALKAGKDPVQFRLEHIQEDEAGHRLREVIKAAAEKAGWKDEVVNGRAMGFAASTDARTPCAQVAEVSIENGEIKVHKVTCAIDPGIAVNPDQVRAQCEGSIIMGQSAAMYERMFVKDSQLLPTIYGPYRMALMRDAPKEIDVVILENAEAPGAVGEPPLGPIGAAIANAVFRLTGERLRSLPLAIA